MRKKKGVAWLLSVAMIMSSVQMGMVPVAAEPVVETTESDAGESIEEIPIEEDVQDKIIVEENVKNQKNVEEKVGQEEESQESNKPQEMQLNTEYPVTINQSEKEKWFSLTTTENGDYPELFTEQYLG